MINIKMKSKKGGIVIIETFLSIFILFVFFIIFADISQKENFLYESSYELAKEVFNDQILRECFDSLDFGCYEHMQGCLNRINEFYSGNIIICVMDDYVYPNLPQKEVSSFRLYKSMKKGEFKPHEIGLYLIKD